MHDFLTFWKQCRLPREQRHPVLVCLFISLDESCQFTIFDRILGKKDTNLEIRATLENLKFEQFGLHGVMLPEAENISLGDVEDWLLDWQVKQKYGQDIYRHLKNGLKSFFSKNNTDSLSLEDVAEYIYDLLPSPATRKSP